MSSEIDPLSIECPSCGAAAWQKCVKLLPGPHRERVAKAAGGGTRNPHPTRRDVKGKRGPRNPRNS